MRYFFDTEFIEDGKTIDLISIGIVAEDGREYYAISADFDLSNANGWVKENVLKQLPRLSYSLSVEESRTGLTLDDKLPHPYKKRSKIRDEVLSFIGQDSPEIWAYYAAYDWVVLCQLFGTMMDLPKGWPMFCLDVKQLCHSLGNPALPEQTSTEHHALNDAIWTKQAWEYLAKLTPQEGGEG